MGRDTGKMRKTSQFGQSIPKGLPLAVGCTDLSVGALWSSRRGGLRCHSLQATGREEEGYELLTGPLRNRCVPLSVGHGGPGECGAGVLTAEPSPPHRKEGGTCPRGQRQVLPHSPHADGRNKPQGKGESAREMKGALFLAK